MMKPNSVRGSLVFEILAELGIEDPKSVYEIRITPGHVLVHGYSRNDLDEFFAPDGNPARWSRAFPIDFEAAP